MSAPAVVDKSAYQKCKVLYRSNIVLTKREFKYERSGLETQSEDPDMFGSIAGDHYDFSPYSIIKVFFTSSPLEIFANFSKKEAYYFNMFQSVDNYPITIYYLLDNYRVTEITYIVNYKSRW